MSPFSIISLVVAVGFIALTVVPLGTVLLRLFVVDGQITLAPLQETLQQDVLSLVGSTVFVVAGSTVFAVLIGGALAWLNERTDARMGLFSDLLPMVPFLLPPVAGSVGWILLLAPTGGYLNSAWMKMTAFFGVEEPVPLMDIYSWSGLILVFTVYGVAFTYMMIAPALRMLDSSLEEQSRVTGAGAIRTLFKVTLPAVLPAIAAGALLWVWVAFATVDIPSMIGTGADITLLSQQIVNLLVFSYPPKQGVAVGLSLIISVVVLGAWLLQSRILRSNKFATVGGKGSRSTPLRLGKWRPVARGAMIGYVLLTTALPCLALLIVALTGSWRADIDWGSFGFSHFADIFSNSYAMQGLANSFTLGLTAATIVVVVAALVSLYVARSGPVLGRVIDVGIKLPATLGALVIVVGMVLLFTGPPFYLSGTTFLLLLAYCALCLPNASISADAAVAGVGGELTEASRISGAPESKTFMRVILPLMVPALVGAWALVFVRVLSDLTASSLLAGANNPVIGFQMLELSRYGSFTELAVLASILAVVSTITVFAAVWFGRWSSRWTQAPKVSRRRPANLL
ncbi:iron ABC transporter permease [Arthrobacter sp. zg-Y1219]|uniref:ABC transporter permease n=1 Tax=Arthrobacter sp. zg-Y1219 TaxID=3049067 RepID=UPI0024C39FAF|nr:iron ABC transporter permease [Arthrobacter sp. zg-Y1219]MDK1361674.1 iron ABC transporter permease [Arthrobacter sp. zg-Y1219]